VRAVDLREDAGCKNFSEFLPASRDDADDVRESIQIAQVNYFAR
jgi:hypothetical protein